ncbi:MAG: hypothetical protein Q7K37_10485 [Dehalococcoidia bacterium]|nr:hypothetical protein [Dehalococcoidia bacterium]
MRRLLLPLAVSLVALLSAACITAEIEIRVNDDGSGTSTVVFTFDRVALEALAQGEEIPNFADEVDTSTLPEGATVEPIDTETSLGVKVTVPFPAGSDVGQAIEDTFAAVGGEDGAFLTGEDGVFESFTLHQEGDLWLFSATTAVPDMDGEDAGDLALAATMLKDAKLFIRIALPGKVTEQNADTVETDGALLWDLPFLATTSRTLSAQSDVSDPGISVPLVTGIAIAVLVIGGLGFAAMRRRSASAPAEAAPPETPAE